MRAVGWSNGSPSSSGAGYGLKVSVGDRDRFFECTWTEVLLDLPEQGGVSVRLSVSFWRDCWELRSAAEPFERYTRSNAYLRDARTGRCSRPTAEVEWARGF